MSIADKLTAIAENMQAVYDAGKTAGGDSHTAVSYITRNWQYMFQNAVFPDGYEMTVDTDFGADMTAAFYGAKGIRKLTVTGNSANNAISAGNAFRQSTIEEIDFSGFGDGALIPKGNGLGSYTYQLRVIRGALDCSQYTSGTINLFYDARAIEDLEFKDGTIGTAFTIAQSSKLTDASIQSIIVGLAALTGQTAQTVTFHADVGAKLTDEQKAVITAKNWTLVY